MKGFVFTLDAIMALLLVIFVTISFAQLYHLESGVPNSELKVTANSALLAMEESGFIGTAANGKNSTAEVQAFLSRLLPDNVNANISIQRFQPKDDGSFQVKYTLNASTGQFFRPFTSSRRVAIVKRKDRNEFGLVELTVGFK